jgi:hypothetical protein
MPQGLEVYNASGAVSLSFTDRITRFVAQYSVTATSGSFVDITAPCTTDGTWASFASELDTFSCQVSNGFIRVRTYQSGENAVTRTATVNLIRI